MYHDHNKSDGFKRSAWDTRDEILTSGNERHVDQIHNSKQNREKLMTEVAEIKRVKEEGPDEAWNASTTLERNHHKVPPLVSNTNLAPTLTQYTSLQAQFNSSLNKQRESKRLLALAEEKRRLDEEIQQLVLRGDYEQVLRKAHDLNQTLTLKTMTGNVEDTLKQQYNASTAERAHRTLVETFDPTSTQPSKSRGSSGQRLRPISHLSSVETLMQTQLSSGRLHTLAMPTLKKTLPDSNNPKICYKRTDNKSYMYLKPKPKSSYSEIPLYKQMNIPDEPLSDSEDESYRDK